MSPERRMRTRFPTAGLYCSSRECIVWRSITELRINVKKCPDINLFLTWKELLEPIGLTPRQVREKQGFVREIVESGVTVFRKK